MKFINNLIVNIKLLIIFFSFIAFLYLVPPIIKDEFDPCGFQSIEKNIYDINKYGEFDASDFDVSCPQCDINKDGKVNISDLDIIGNHMIFDVPCPDCDINKDGVINIYDARSIGNRIPGEIKIQRLEPIELQTSQIIKQLQFDIKIKLADESIEKNVTLIYDGPGDRNLSLDNNNTLYGQVRINLQQHGDYPFETDCAPIKISMELNPENLTKPIYAWGENRNVSINTKGNYIQISMRRMNKETSEWLYFIGIGILLLYLVCFIYSYRDNSANNLTLFTAYIYIGQFLFIAIVFAGMKEQLFTYYGIIFIILTAIFAKLAYIKTKIKKKPPINYDPIFEY